MLKYLITFFIVVLLFGSCRSKKTELIWDQSFYNLGSSASPRAVDLNEDGVLDIVMGAGNAEMGPTKQGVFAVDGVTGKLLWKQKANAHMVGSATFYDITEDGIPDIFIGGRNHNLFALNGKTGNPIWSYEYRFEKDPILKYARFNYYNNVLVSNKNNTPDLLTINGGNWDAPPHTMKDRFPGVLLLFDLKYGDILASGIMPDGKESYMSPICFTQKNSTVQNIIFGTGGETVGGNLYWTTIEALKNNNLSKAELIASEKEHGFIAPPVIADINGDEILDVIAISHAATVFAIDGKSKKLLWKKSFENMEASSSFAVGHFNEDKIPDFFAILSKGVWPDYNTALYVSLDGRDGSILYQDSTRCFSLSSPVVYDLDNDQLDDVIFSSNQYDCSMEFTDLVTTPPDMKNQLVAVGAENAFLRIIDETVGFKNIFSTPWIGDLDKDGYLDIVYCQYYNAENLFRFLGMRIKRISTSVQMNKPVKWGEYMGAEGKNIFTL